MKPIFLSRIFIFKTLKYFLLFVIGALFITQKTTAEEFTIQIPKPRSAFDISHDYHQKLLSMALNKAAKGRKIPKINAIAEMSQGRAKAELIKGKLINLYWFGTSLEMENDLRAIQVPTTKGLIGYRKFLIRKDTKPTFDNIKNLDDLSQLIACQGSHWPDTKILQAAKLKVVTTPTYENIFSMLNAKRCDYFPRGYHDTDNDLRLRKDLFNNLTSYHKILLHYPFAVYFFTNKENEALALWIEAGLTMLAEEGEIDEFMRQHPLTAHIYPLKDEKNTLYLPISNPLLNTNTDIQNNKKWFTPKDFNITQ